uniref:B30.2/SPRY domain-containing protein n=1 Tax=Cyprinus carpio TaxID=7962 RepID=A0A8C2I049_CYPCA
FNHCTEEGGRAEESDDEGEMNKKGSFHKTEQNLLEIRCNKSSCCLYLSSAPVTLDPNTANTYLILSGDLTSLTSSETWQQIPDNPERFDEYSCVLGSEGFNSGTHFWDVEVGDNSEWVIGVTTESNQRKGTDFFYTNVWCIWFEDGKYFLQAPEKPNSTFPVKEKLQRVRVELDWDRGKLSFCDPVNNTHLHTITTTFTERVFPLFYTFDGSVPLKILPATVVITTEKTVLHMPR